MNKTKKRRKRCVECDELYNDDDINMLYHFKTDEEAEQHCKYKWDSFLKWQCLVICVTYKNNYV